MTSINEDIREIADSMEGLHPIYNNITNILRATAFCMTKPSKLAFQELADICKKSSENIEGFL